MSKTFKVVCIESDKSTFLKQGGIYDAKPYKNYPSDCWDISTEGGNENYSYRKRLFLRLPIEPKTCTDMTMEEYLAMTCLRCYNPSLMELSKNLVSPIPTFKLVIGKYMPAKFDNYRLYRIKPKKSDKYIKIEHIEKEMCKLADELAEIKGQ